LFSFLLFTPVVGFSEKGLLSLFLLSPVFTSGFENLSWTLQDKIIYRLKDKKRKQTERLHIPPQQTQIENSKAKSRMTNVRDNKTCEQKKDLRVNDKTRKQEERSNMSPEQKVKRVDVYLEVRKRRGLRLQIKFRIR
jgi:hypothetical protein